MIEIVFKAVKQPRLTIAKERVTLKIPLTVTDGVLIARLTDFSIKAQLKFQPMIVNTLRGQIEINDKLSVALSDDNGHIYERMEI